jgi:hypothetical protein
MGLFSAQLTDKWLLFTDPILHILVDYRSSSGSLLDALEAERPLTLRSSLPSSFPAPKSNHNNCQSLNINPKKLTAKRNTVTVKQRVTEKENPI